MVKPDGVKKRLVGEIISRFEKKGLYLVQLRVLIPTSDILKEHYAPLASRPFFNELILYMQTGQVVAMILEGDNAVKIARDMIGDTNPLQAAIGTIRGDYGIYVGKNVVHGSDSIESAEREIGIWFGKDISAVIHFDKDLYYENK